MSLSAKQKIAVLFPWQVPEDIRDRWSKKFPNFEFIIHVKAFDPAKLRTTDEISDEEWKDVVALLTPSSLPKPEQVPALHFVQLTSAGANLVIDKPLFTDTKIPFTSARGAYDPQIAEWAVSTFLGLRHHLYRFYDFQKQQQWEKIRDPVPSSIGQTLGVLGYGSIGRQVASVSKALGFKVHAYTLHPKNTPESRRSDSGLADNLGDPEGKIPEKWFSGTTKEELHEFLNSGLDLLLISVPLTSQTKHLIGHEEFQILSKRKTFISNIARGPILKTDDLVESLEKGLIAGAALDVTDPEPLPESHPLWKAPNVIITPHISSSSTASPERVLRIFEYNLEQFVAGKRLINIIDREDKY